MRIKKNDMKVNMILAVVKNGIKPLLDKTAFSDLVILFRY